MGLAMQPRRVPSRAGAGGRGGSRATGATGARRSGGGASTACRGRRRDAQDPWSLLLGRRSLGKRGHGKTPGAALEDRALEDREASTSSSSNATETSSPSAPPEPFSSSSLLPSVNTLPPRFAPVNPDSVKVRVARNSEELKAVAALRVSIFQQFKRPDARPEGEGEVAKKGDRRVVSAGPFKLARQATGGRAGSPSPTAQQQLQAKHAESAKRGGFLGSGPLTLECAAQADLELRDQWLRKQSGLEAARIYNLGERCLCLLAVYHPRDDEERERLLRFGAEQLGERETGRGDKGEGEGLEGRLLSPFFRWHAPPVPKVPPQHAGKAGDANPHALEANDGGLIVGTLNIHFDQPFRPKARQGGMGPGAKPATKQQAAAYLQHSNNMSVLRAVENTHGRATSARAKMLNSLWRIKHQYRHTPPSLEFFNLPSEEKALQKVRRGCKQAYIFNLCVSPAFRRQGIASMLLDRAHDFAVKKEVRECFLHVDYGNDAAERLYRENGYSFEEDEEGKWTYIAGTRPRQLMKKRIK